MTGRSLESWYAMPGAPKGEPVALLVLFDGKLKPVVGECPLPTIPASAG
jgi:hypothetical protein